MLVFVQGVGNESDNGGYKTFWGENLVGAMTAPPDIPPSRLVYSPHVYGPTVFPQEYFKDETFPENMPGVWDTHFGALAAMGGTVVPGEFGSHYHDLLVEGSEVWMDAFVTYL